ncbi:hypothetical protein ACERK3_10800 [Phycisphaerales bacterium AB-hyl4]|uniref:Uncharacterized protein n=1 Tax=Natronomicrosphaera hydrolytica TaxID=3242702 RepID=A0ABV4U7I7_9BACT
MLVDEFRDLAYGETNFSDELDDHRTFKFASRISHQLGYSFACRLVEHFRRGELLESLKSVASLGPVALGVAPYIAAMKTQHKDEPLLQATAARFACAQDQIGRSGKRACIPTPTYGIAFVRTHSTGLESGRGKRRLVSFGDCATRSCQSRRSIATTFPAGQPLNIRPLDRDDTGLCGSIALAAQDCWIELPYRCQQFV